MANPRAMASGTFLRSGEGAVASYSYTDVAEGTGVIIFNGFASQDSSATDYHLSTQSIRSKAIEASGSSGSNFTVSQDFDLTPYNLPRRATGTAIVEFSHFKDILDVGGTMTAKAEVFHVTSGGSATSLGSATSATYSSTSDDIINECLVFDLTSQLFKKGEVLRLTITLTRAGTQGSVETMAFGCDPLNRDGDNITPSTVDCSTQLKAYIPFDIDL